MNFDIAEARLPAAQRDVEAASEAYSAALAKADELRRAILDGSQGYQAALEEVRQCKAALGRARLTHGTLRKIVDRGPPEIVTTSMVENPDRADHEVEHRIATGAADTTALNEVVVREASRIGGLARVKTTPLQAWLAGEYRKAYEAAQIGGARAIDYTLERVDSSGGAMVDLTDFAATARAKYSEAVRLLGLLRSHLVEQVVCHELSIKQAGRQLGWGDGGASQARVREQVLAAIDLLEAVFGSGPKGGGRRGVRRAGERADWIGVPVNREGAAALAA